MPRVNPVSGSSWPCSRCRSSRQRRPSSLGLVEARLLHQEDEPDLEHRRQLLTPVVAPLRYHLGAVAERLRLGQPIGLDVGPRESVEGPDQVVRLYSQLLLVDRQGLLSSASPS